MNLRARLGRVEAQFLRNMITDRNVNRKLTICDNRILTTLSAV